MFLSWVLPPRSEKVNNKEKCLPRHAVTHTQWWSQINLKPGSQIQRLYSLKSQNLCTKILQSKRRTHTAWAVMIEINAVKHHSNTLVLVQYMPHLWFCILMVVFYLRLYYIISGFVSVVSLVVNRRFLTTKQLPTTLDNLTRPSWWWFNLNLKFFSSTVMALTSIFLLEGF